MKTTVDRLLMNLRGYKEKAFALLATSYKGSQANGATLVICNMPYSDIICVASRGRMIDGKNRQCLEPCPVEGKTNCLTTVEKITCLCSGRTVTTQVRFIRTKHPR